MKNLLKCSSLIRVAVIIVVMAFMASQMTCTYAKEMKLDKHDTDIKADIAQHDTDIYNDVVTHDGNMTTEHGALATEHSGLDTKLDEILSAVQNGNGTDCDVCPPPVGITKGWVPKTGSTINVDPGEDGNLLKGVAWPNPRFTVNLDGTVTDNLTCLIWDPDANRFGQRTWAEALNDCGTSSFGGHNDWRLPNVMELHSLIHYGVSLPALPDTAGTGQWTTNGEPFSDVPTVVAAFYWSSTTFANFTGEAWVVGFDGGFVINGVKGNDFYVWCVRGGP